MVRRSKCSAVCGVAFLAVLSLLLNNCAQAPAQPPALPPPQVTVTKPLQQEVTDFRDFTGRVEAVEQAEIRVRVRGFLEKIHFREGTEVKKGDLLYEIDPRSYQADLERTIAEQKQQEAQLALAKAEEARAAQIRGTVGALPEEEFAKRVAVRQAAEGALERARATVSSARLELSYTKIYAPISGRISRTLITEGNLVGFNEPTLLTTIVQVDPVYVFFEVPESQYLEYQGLIREERAAQASEQKIPLYVGLSNEQDFPHSGVINFRDNRIDTQTGTVQIRGEVPNPERILLPGLFARVRVPFGKPKQRMLVPELAISSDQRGQFVLSVQADNTVAARPIKTGRSVDGLVVIDEGLKPDESIIVNGLQRARPGAKVAPITEAQSAPPAPPQNTPPSGTGATPPPNAPSPPPTASPPGSTR
jgi:membrane fusion protein, multidrug efflux system